MTPQGAAVQSELLRRLLAQTGDELTAVISGALANSIMSMFSQKIHAVKGRAPGQYQPYYAATVEMVQAPSSFRLRLAFDTSLLKTLLANVFPLDAVNSEETLKDAVAEVANIIAGHIKTFANQHGFELTRDMPVPEGAGNAGEIPASALNLNFSIFRNHLSGSNLLNVSLM